MHSDERKKQKTKIVDKEYNIIILQRLNNIKLQYVYYLILNLFFIFQLIVYFDLKTIIY